MKKKALTLLLIFSLALPSSVFAYLYNEDKETEKGNKEHTLAVSEHVVSDIEVTRTSPFPECGTLTNHKGLTADYNDKGQIEAIRICNTAVVASHSSNLRYSNRMTWLVSPQYQKALAVRQDNNPEAYPANTQLYFMTTVKRADLLLAFGDKLDQLDYIDSGAVIRSGYRNADMSFSPTNEGDWGYLSYGPAYHLGVKDYTFYQNELKQEPGFKVFSGAAPQDMLDMFARYKLERSSVNLIANSITPVGASTSAKAGVEIGFTVDVDTLALHHLI